MSSIDDVFAGMSPRYSREKLTCRTAPAPSSQDRPTDPATTSQRQDNNEHYLKRELYQLVLTESQIFELLQEGSLYVTLTETLPHVIWLSAPDGRVTYQNRAYRELTGRSPTETLGLGWVQDIHPDDREGFLKQWKAAHKHGEGYRGECRLRARDKSYRTMSYTGTPVKDEAGNSVQWVGVHTDVTERQRAEERLVERTAQLEAANRELEAFSYSISHDLRAPLRAVDGFSRILMRDHLEEVGARAEHYLQRIRSNTRRLGELIDDLLSFSRLSRQTLQLQPVQPERLVREVLEELREMRKGRRVEIELGALPGCRADWTLLKQVYVNLISNALKFTGRREVARIRIGARNDAATTTYFVADNGAGFDMRDAGKLFGVFQRLHRTEDYEGNGVGLALVQRIISRHNGEAWAEAAPGEGATFYFTLEEADRLGQ